jgi:hypothetical protein
MRVELPASFSQAVGTGGVDFVLFGRVVHLHSNLYIRVARIFFAGRVTGVWISYGFGPVDRLNPNL